MNQYVADMVYVLRADIKLKGLKPSAYQATVRIVGQGYTRKGGDAATIARSFSVTDATEAGAIETVLFRIQHGVAKRIARWQNRLPRLAMKGSVRDEDGNAIRIYLQGAPDDGLIELFDTIIRNTPGVIKANRIRSRLKPSYPGGSITVWRVEIEDVDPFFIESNIMQTVKDHFAVEQLIKNRDDQIWDHTTFNYLRWIRPGDASTEKLCFIVDWCAAGDRRCPDRSSPRNKCDFRRWQDRGFE